MFMSQGLEASPQSRWTRILRGWLGTHNAEPVDMDTRLSRARFRAWHRGTREADFMIGSYFDHHHLKWNEDEVEWFENLLEEDDVDIMGWALRAQPVPEQFQGPQMLALQRLDYVKV